MTRLFAAALVAGLIFTALPALADDGANITRTVVVGMDDSMRFSPGRMAVARGETLKIVARNDGQAMHEMVLGTHMEIEELRKLMRRDPHRAHAAPNMAHVAPGASEPIVWRFDQPGTLVYACLLPGHYEAGMHGTITVQ